MKNQLLVGAIMLVSLAACSEGSKVDATATLMEACNTQQGIGWLKKTYGEKYCDCWVSQSKASLGEENYERFVSANDAALKAVDKADREKIASQYTELYSTVSSAAKVCVKSG